jgi:polar amino acid transport system substrate-binding protein
MTITADREEGVDFSDPYANAMLALLTNKDSGITKAEEINIAGKVIAVRTGSTGHLYAQNNLTNAGILALADESACVTEVAQGKADGFIYDQLTIYRNWQNNLDTTNAVFIPFQDVDMWGVAVQEGNDELREQLNTFIAEFTADGGFDRLSEKYLADEKAAFDQLGFQWFFDVKR